MGTRNFALALALLASLSACQQQNAASSTPDANAVAAAGGAAAAPVASLWNGGAAKPLDIQVANPNGTVLQLTSLQSRPTDTAVGIRVINGRDRDVDLNRFNNREGYILLDTGEKLYLSPPATNTKLTIPAGQTFEGELVFLGRLPPAKTAILVMNENSSGNSEYSTTPQFRVDLPLAGAAQ